MKILIVGSLKTQEESVRSEFIGACKDIGAELARRRHTVIVGSNNPKTADPHILAGASTVEGQHRVIVIRGDDDREVPRQEQYPSLSFQYRRRGDNWSVARAFQLREAEAVIAMGGSSGTLQTGMTAPAMEKPVLGVSMFGGSGRVLWNEFKSDYARIGLTDDELSSLEDAAWSQKSASTLVDTVELLIRRNPYQTNFVALLSGVLLIELSLMVLWVFLFVSFTTEIQIKPEANPSGPDASFSYALFALLGISSFLGSGMRMALPMLEGRVVSLMQLLKEMTVGLFLAFGFVLIFLSTGILLLGEVTLDAEHFRNAAVSTSLMGFAAAFFAERSAEKLRQRLGDQI